MADGLNPSGISAFKIGLDEINIELRTNLTIDSKEIPEEARGLFVSDLLGIFPRKVQHINNTRIDGTEVCRTEFLESLFEGIKLIFRSFKDGLCGNGIAVLGIPILEIKGPLGTQHTHCTFVKIFKTVRTFVTAVFLCTGKSKGKVYNRTRIDCVFIFSGLRFVHINKGGLSVLDSKINNHIVNLGIVSPRNPFVNTDLSIVTGKTREQGTVQFVTIVSSNISRVDCRNYSATREKLVTVESLFRGHQLHEAVDTRLRSTVKFINEDEHFAVKFEPIRNSVGMLAVLDLKEADHITFISKLSAVEGNKRIIVKSLNLTKSLHSLGFTDARLSDDDSRSGRILVSNVGEDGGKFHMF